MKHKIKDPTDFEWLKQARFYWREDKDTVIISVCDVDFEYSYEYLGVKERLVDRHLLCDSVTSSGYVPGRRPSWPCRYWQDRNHQGGLPLPFGHLQMPAHLQ